MKNQKGITLVALVVTIVVLLILAATSIAMLRGDSGIITNAQKSSYSSTEGEVVERIKVAFNGLKTEILVKSNTETTYVATDVASLKDLLANFVKDLGLTPNTSLTGTTTPASMPANLLSTDSEKGYTVAYASNKITITYTDNTFKSGQTSVKDKNGNNVGTIQAEITITTNDVEQIKWTPTTPYFITNY